jgi:glucose-6-phosphate isomerase
MIVEACGIKAEKKQPGKERLEFYECSKSIAGKVKRLRLDCYMGFKNIVLIGNGGSVNPLVTLSMPFLKGKRLFVVDTEEPGVLRRALSLNKKSTLVIAASKSGETSSVVMPYCLFKGFKSIVLTGNAKGTLAKLGKEFGAKIIKVPGISGRFSGFTETCFVPLFLLGVDIERVAEGGRRVSFEDAWRLAVFFHECEKKGFYDVFLSIYSRKLSGLYWMASQMVHETIGKSRKGLTLYGGIGPETQHHTNQRVFGGRKNTAALLVYAKDSEKASLGHNVKAMYGGKPLGLLKGRDFNSLVLAEYLGTKNATKECKVPCACIETEISEENVGELLMLLYLFSYYSARLRGMSPFDQPAVEKSKRITKEILFGGK